MSMLHVLSLGAGVQSSTIALMAAHGAIDPMPDCAIFADTGAEPQKVYDWLEYLTSLLPFQVHKVSAGNLQDDFLAALSDPKGRCGQPPFMVVNHTKKDAKARIWRKCTKDYKLNPIRKKVAKLRKDGGYSNVQQLIGISLDEAHRMKSSGVKYITNIYPLIDKRMTRHDCLSWMKDHAYPEPPKSACVFCPYSNNARLRKMRDQESEDWERLVWFDAEMRRRQGITVNGARITGTLYVHRDCVPIDQVDLRTPEDYGQSDMFGNECEGMCGV